MRRFGNGHQRFHQQEAAKVWSTGDDFLRKCLVTLIFLVVSAILALGLYFGQAALASLKACRSGGEVNSFLYKQTVSECFWSRMSERRDDLGRWFDMISGK